MEVSCQVDITRRFHVTQEVEVVGKIVACIIRAETR
jgi:hypothetical protein